MNNNLISATEARKDLSQVIDNAVHDRPQFIKRTRDYVCLISNEMLLGLLSNITFTANEFTEDDGSITVSLKEIDLVENGCTIEDAHNKMAKSILEYAQDYYNEFSLWSSAPNRADHIKYVLLALILNNHEKIRETIKWQHGKN